MTARSLRVRAERGLLLLFAAGWLWLAGGCLAGAWAEDPATATAAHLAAGEFGPARMAAEQLADVAARDRLLGEIAVAQARSGARSAAIDTLYSVASDQARSRSLGQLRSAPPLLSRGGGVQADFDALIDLIKSTVAPQSWDDVGGPGAVEEFATGVFVDAAGLLKKLPAEADRSLAILRRSAATPGPSGDPARRSPLRKVSLPRLEREAQLRAAMGQPPDEAMLALAGLRRVKYVLLYPDTGDVVLAGPAGDWRRDREGRLIAGDSSAPILRLDDLVVTLRNAYSDEPTFGCSITPTAAGLANIKTTMDRWAAQPLRPSQRERWLRELRDALGKQDITVHGIDPRTHAARVIVEADYRMKLVGMGLEEGTLGVTSYLASVEPGADGSLPPMDVLRWWFTVNYAALRASAERDAFEIRGPGAKVLSENELLTDRGERVHTGKSDELNSRFAQSFTRHFETLAAKYPIYAELRNVFDLALVAAVLRAEDAPSQAGWHLTHFGPGGDYQPALGAAPKQVDSVINHRLINGKQIVAGVSGGVVVDVRGLVARDQIQTTADGALSSERAFSAPHALPRGAWWWD